jgi:hypothetical protein
MQLRNFGIRRAQAVGDYGNLHRYRCFRFKGFAACSEPVDGGCVDVGSILCSSEAGPIRQIPPPFGQCSAELKRRCLFQSEDSRPYSWAA